MDDEDGEERVGYGKPPRRTRFKPGHSGNRKGRPKGAESRKAIVRRVAGEVHRMIERGTPRWRSTLELMLLRLRARASTGDVQAFAAYSALLARFGAEPPDPNTSPRIFMWEPPTDAEMEQYERESRERQRKMLEEYQARRAQAQSPRSKRS